FREPSSLDGVLSNFISPAGAPNDETGRQGFAAEMIIVVVAPV
ncbi:MAG: hypothetical protein QOJ51_5680, partial [Acidobacteriaceae bacterium]|nr:hypothetical protein [Acidobacteriaceae bacterium]